MPEPFYVDVVITSDVRTNILKLVSHRFNLLLRRLPSLWKEDGVLLGSHCVYVDLHSAELSGTYFIETQPLDSSYLYILSPYHVERDIVVKCGSRYANTKWTRTDQTNAWGFYGFNLAEDAGSNSPCVHSESSHPCLPTCAVPGAPPLLSIPACAGQAPSLCIDWNAPPQPNDPGGRLASTPISTDGTDHTQPACASGCASTPSPSSMCAPGAGDGDVANSNSQSAKEVILRDIKAACECIESISLEGLGTLDDYADLIRCAREASAAQEAACETWANELSEMTQCALSIEEAICNIRNQLQLPQQVDYTKVLEGMKDISVRILSIKQKLAAFDEIPNHMDTYHEFRRISSHYDTLKVAFQDIQESFTKLACGGGRRANSRHRAPRNSPPFAPLRASEIKRPRRCGVKPTYLPADRGCKNGPSAPRPTPVPPARLEMFFQRPSFGLRKVSNTPTICDQTVLGGIRNRRNIFGRR